MTITRVHEVHNLCSEKAQDQILASDTFDKQSDSSETDIYCRILHKSPL